MLFLAENDGNLVDTSLTIRVSGSKTKGSAEAVLSAGESQNKAVQNEVGIQDKRVEGKRRRNVETAITDACRAGGRDTF